MTDTVDSPHHVTEAKALPRRTLVGELLLTQLGVAALVGMVAVVSVWSIAGWVVRDHIGSWARQWMEELDALGGALYLAEDPDRFLRVEHYVERFPEISFVRFYSADGAVIFAEGAPEALQLSQMSPDELAALIERPDNVEHHFDDAAIAPLIRVVGTVRLTSMVSDALFELDSLDEVETDSAVVGFVELGLDYTHYDRQLLESMVFGSAATGLVFLVLMMAARWLLRRAVRPLIALQAPLKRLAEGDYRIELPSSHYREVAAIGEALHRAADSIRGRDSRLRRLANFDDLTGLPNRRHFEERVAAELAAVGDRDPGALLFLDLDHFKYINDTLGHTAGDRVLRQVAARISATLGEAGLVARFGGDEFMILLRGVGRSDALTAAEKLLRDVGAHRLVIDQQSFTLNATIGMTLLSPHYTVEELLAQADMACHQAKREGRNVTRLFEPEAGAAESLRTDFQQVALLKAALREDRFSLVFQPIMSVTSGEFSHYEVLLRLRQGDELLPPGAFLSAAERFDLMRDVDRWVISRALARLAQLRRAAPALRFTINVSGSSFASGDLPAFVEQELIRHQLPPAAVVFEITEQVAVGDVADATRQIDAIMQLGCEFAIDDFGAGYSSLSYLKQLPMQYIKIDGGFIGRIVDSPVDQVIVRSIAEIARSLNKKTVAEFVGDEPTLLLLRELGIDYAQGYFIGKPSESLMAESTKLLPPGVATESQRAPRRVS